MKKLVLISFLSLTALANAHESNLSPECEQAMNYFSKKMELGDFKNPQSDVNKSYERIGEVWADMLHVKRENKVITDLAAAVGLDGKFNISIVYRQLGITKSFHIAFSDKYCTSLESMSAAYFAEDDYQAGSITSFKEKWDQQECLKEKHHWNIGYNRQRGKENREFLTSACTYFKEAGLIKIESKDEKNLNIVNSQTTEN